MLRVADSLLPIHSNLVHALAEGCMLITLQKAAHHALFIAAYERNAPLRSKITAAIVVVVILGTFLTQHSMGKQVAGYALHQDGAEWLHEVQDQVMPVVLRAVQYSQVGIQPYFHNSSQHISLA